MKKEEALHLVYRTVADTSWLGLTSQRGISGASGAQRWMESIAELLGALTGAEPTAEDIEMITRALGDSWVIQTGAENPPREATVLRFTPTCTRDAGHSGPCNGLPCDWMLGFMNACAGFPEDVAKIGTIDDDPPPPCQHTRRITTTGASGAETVVKSIRCADCNTVLEWR